MKINSLLNITLDYALSQFEEEILNSIIEEELSIIEKKEVIMNMDEKSKRIILLKIGFKKEFLKTI
jgi:hypothetical protein